MKFRYQEIEFLISRIVIVNDFERKSIARIHSERAVLTFISISCLTGPVWVVESQCIARIQLMQELHVASLCRPVQCGLMTFDNLFF